MNINDKLGPIIADISGIELTQVDRELLCHPKLGGLILFTRNFESTEQLHGLIRVIRELRPGLFLSVDHEGGRVQRFREGFSVIPAMASLGALYSEDKAKALNDAYAYGWLLAYELTSIGIDHSYAPVLDLDDHLSQVIGDRSFSKDASITTALAEQFILGMSEAGMAATAKHFPGHGSVVADSHIELPVDRRSYDEVYRHDLQPFIALKSHYKAIMTAHISFPDVDERPVSFSSEWISGILRKKIGFDGVVISDDLSMKGASVFGDVNNCAELAITAGCDAILICNARPEAERALEFLEANNLGESGRLNHLMSRFDSTRCKPQMHDKFKAQLGL